MLKLHVKYDRSGNSGSFLTGEFNGNDDGVDVDFDVLDEVAEDPAKVIWPLYSILTQDYTSVAIRWWKESADKFVH